MTSLISLFLLLFALNGAANEDPSFDEPILDLADELGAPGTPPASEVELDQLVRTINKGLRCPVCQGSSIQDSPVDSAVAMRTRVRELAAQGYTKAQIEQYFVDRYGEWILQSPATAENWIVWICPSLGGGLALAILAGVALGWRREPDDDDWDDDTASNIPLDRFEKQLLDEINK